jgi:primosomal replication protein N
MKERVMNGHLTRLCVLAASAAVLVVELSPVAAQTQTKTREQAWNVCVNFVKEHRSDSPEAGSERTAALKACMASLGYPNG